MAGPAHPSAPDRGGDRLIACGAAHPGLGRRAAPDERDGVRTDRAAGASDRIGGGPIGRELAQAHRRLGARVTILELFRVLPKDDPDAVRIVRDQPGRGDRPARGRSGQAVAPEGNAIAVTFEQAGVEQRITGSHVLVASGRRANVDGLGLEAAGIQYSEKGIKVDARLRTSNKRVYAIGDVVGGLQFTHLAAHHASVVLKNILFKLPAKVEERAVPWVTYTNPELAHVGLTEALAKEHGIAVQALRWSFEENDRARTERDTGGFAKVLVDRRGRIHGATIVGERAGADPPWVLALSNGIKIGAMAQFIAPYPTLGEVSKRAAGITRPSCSASGPEDSSVF